MNTLFECREVSFAYPGRKPSVADITLHVARGEHLALLGANGAGKSTLLLLLAGLEFPTAGSILFEHRPLTADALGEKKFRAEFRSRVGVMFQNSDAQLFCGTVLDEVAFGALQTMPRDAAVDRAQIAMRTVGVDHLATEAPYALSGGEKRRVALACMLAMEPDVLLLDEPAANLDPRTSDLLYDVLDAYTQDPAKTVIIATHDLEAAQNLAVNCAVLTPEHTIALHAAIDDVLRDEDLLRQVNLIGEPRRPNRRRV